MNLNNFILITALVTAVMVSHLQAQCSDAGVCAIGYTPNVEQRQHTFDLQYRYGYSGKEDKIGYNSLELKAAIGVFTRTTLQISAPVYRYNSGTAGKAKGIGDLMVFINQDFEEMLGYDISALFGMRLATGDDNAEPDLPQAYQPGLGTNDLIFGIKFSDERYNVAAGYQLVEDTFTSNRLTPIRRGDDLYLQYARFFDLGGVDLKAETQLIKRLSRTRLRNPDGSVSELEKTDQLQINLGVEARYGLNETSSLIGGFAFPVLKRESNADGLTRVLTFFAGWRLNI
jgi:hypothetical protein